MCFGIRFAQAESSYAMKFCICDRAFKELRSAQVSSREILGQFALLESHSNEVLCPVCQRSGQELIHRLLSLHRLKRHPRSEKFAVVSDDIGASRSNFVLTMRPIYSINGER
jgi:hypothetical protein